MKALTNIRIVLKCTYKEIKKRNFCSECKNSKFVLFYTDIVFLCILISNCRERICVVKVIEFNEFSAYYKDKKDFITALDKITFSVESGELLVIVGESGSGKSTLLKSCLGIAKYFDGELSVFGQNIDEYDIKKANCAYVRQELALYPNITVYENIAFPLRVTHTPQAEVDKRVREIAEMLDISILLTRKPRQISGGQQQRVAIARALVKNPEIIYFDEPFSDLEPAMRHELRMLLLNVHKRFKPTVLFVTHDLTEAFTLADRIIVLEDGRIVEEGKPEEIKENPHSKLMRSFLLNEEDCNG